MASAGPQQTQQKHAAIRRLHHSADEGSSERAVGEFLESTKFEMFIIFLVICDVVLLGLEHGIDRHMLCIGGAVAPMAPGRLLALAEDHSGETHAHFSQLLGGGTVAPEEGHYMLRQRHLRPATDFSALAVADAEAWSPGPFALLQWGARSALPDGHTSHPDGHTSHSDGHEESAHHSSHPDSAHHGHDEAGHGGGHHSHHADAALVCETKNGPQSHEVQHFCHTASIVILAVFLVEILIKLYLHTQEFLHNPFEVLDLVVVSVSLMVDVFVVPMIHDSNAKVNVERMLLLLILCRVWRLVRIVHGTFEVVHHQVEYVEHLNERIAELERELKTGKS